MPPKKAPKNTPNGYPIHPMTLMGTLCDTTRKKSSTQSKEELEEIEQESLEQELPKQEQVFSVSKKYSKLHNLPDPKNPPMGYEPNKGYDNVFPFVKLPFLHPADPEDNISFGFGEAGYLDEKNKKHPLNAVYFGDNLQILRSLPSNSIDLIYIDPPFFSGRVYNQVWGDNNEVRTFNDIWDGGLPTYLIWLNARLWEMKRVLKDTGSIYVHCDWHAGHYIKTEMDKIFGYKNFKNEIKRKSVFAHNDSRQFGRNADSILFYVKNCNKYYFKTQFIEYDSEYLEKTFRNIEPKTGRRYQTVTLTGAGAGPAKFFLGKLRKPPRNRHWAGALGYSIEELEKKGRLVLSKNDVPRVKYYPEDTGGKALQEFWEDAFDPQSQSKENLRYPTQKSEELIYRIISSSCTPSGTVADFFMGGGGTLAVAQKLGRKFIGSDISRVAVSVTLDRLVRDGEEMTGRKASTNKSKEQKQGMLIEKIKVPDVKTYYHGVYPVNKFDSLTQDEFDTFILTCFGASKNTVDDGVTGFKNQFNPILVGPVLRNEELNPEQIKKFVQSVIKNHIQQNQRYVFTILAWRFQPEVKKYTRQLHKNFFKKLKGKGVVLEIELIPIRNHKFRERITANLGLSEEDKEKLLQFVESPIITDIVYKKKKDLTYKFEAIAKSINTDGYLINCQWDFNYQDGNFSEPEYSLNREKTKQGHFEAILTAEKTFEKEGDYKIACKVQDNFGGEAIKIININIK